MLENKITSKSIFLFLIFANILAWSFIFDLNQPQFLEIDFFALGKRGEAIFIKTPGKNQILIDGGEGNLILEKLSKKVPFWDRTIELVILTHPEADHLQGLLEVLRRYKVKNIVWTGVERNTPEFKEWQLLIEKEKARIFWGRAGLKVKEKNLSLIFLYPFEILAQKRVEDSNQTSIVGKLEFGKISFLFTGDIPKSVEEELVLKYGNLGILESDFLKVAHHGSKTSSSGRFLEKVLPEFAIILAGKGNPFGHPHFEVLEKFKKYGIKVFRTDLQGDIKIITDGEKISYEFSNL